jgi:hypothetical protein
MLFSFLGKRRKIPIRPLFYPNSAAKTNAARVKKKEASMPYGILASTYQVKQ